MPRSSGRGARPPALQPSGAGPPSPGPPPSASISSPRVSRPGATPSPAQLAYFVVFNPILAAKRKAKGHSEGNDGQVRARVDERRRERAGAPEETQETLAEGRVDDGERAQREGNPDQAEGEEEGGSNPHEEDTKDDKLEKGDTSEKEGRPEEDTSNPLGSSVDQPTPADTPTPPPEDQPTADTDHANATVEAPAPSEPSTPALKDPGDRDRDLEDDLREAAQIVFYTSRDAGGVSRDTMLRQVGLAKGLMGFTDMIEPSAEPFWAVHSQNTRLIIYTPESDWYIYIGITLALMQGSNKEDVIPAQTLSDRMLVDGLQRGYDDYVFLHGSLSGSVDSPAALSRLEKYWTRFAFSFEATLINPPQPGLLAWLSGYPPPTSQIGSAPLAEFAEEHLPPGSGAGLLGRDGPLAGTGALPPADSREAAALTRFLLSTLATHLPIDHEPPSVVSKGTERQTLGFGFGRRKVGGSKDVASSGTDSGAATMSAKDSTPKEQAQAPTQGAPQPESEKEERKPSWGPLAWVGLGSGSAPTSRAVTPSPAPKDSSHQDKIEAAQPQRRAVSHQHTSSNASVSSVSSVRRWGLGFGNVMGNMGAALGLSPSPAPSPRIPEFKAVTEEGRKVEDGKKEQETEGESHDPAYADDDTRDYKVELKDEAGPESNALQAALDHAVESPSEPSPEAKAAVDEVPPRADVMAETADGTRADATPAEPDEPVVGSFETLAALLGTSVQSSHFSEAEAEPQTSNATPDTDTISMSPPEPCQTPTLERTHLAPHADDLADALATPTAPPEQLGSREDAPALQPTAEGERATAKDTTPTSTVSKLPTLTPDAARDVLPELAAARDDRVDITWTSKTVHLSDGAESQWRRLSWVVRDGALLYILAPDAELRPPPNGSATAQLFEALRPPAPAGGPGVGGPTGGAAGSSAASVRSVSTSTPTGPSGDENTTIYHLGNTTERCGRMLGADGTLAALRDVLLEPSRDNDDGVGRCDTLNEVFGQMPTGRFVVAKTAPSTGTELFVVTARKDASLTDAERAVRSAAFVRPEFS